jgi:hypothetical protein
VRLFLLKPSSTKTFPAVCRPGRCFCSHGETPAILSLSQPARLLPRHNDDPVAFHNVVTGNNRNINIVAINYAVNYNAISIDDGVININNVVVPSAANDFLS